MALKGLLNSIYTIVSGGDHEHEEGKGWHCGLAHDEGSGFQMPLHYPRYKKGDYEKMEDWKLDCLLREYGLSFHGSVQEKRDFAIGTFVWPDQMADN